VLGLGALPTNPVQLHTLGDAACCALGKPCVLSSGSAANSWNPSCTLRLRCGVNHAGFILAAGTEAEVLHHTYLLLELKTWPLVLNEAGAGAFSDLLLGLDTWRAGFRRAHVDKMRLRRVTHSRPQVVLWDRAVDMLLLPIRAERARWRACGRGGG
jgi:hypothetical protein